MGKIALSQKYVLKHLVERLTSIYDMLGIVDEALYDKDEVEETAHDIWYKVRQSRIQIDELVDAIKPD